MKTNMGKVFATLFCMMMCLSLCAQKFTPGMVVGLWNYSALMLLTAIRKEPARSRKPVKTVCRFHNQRYGNDR